MQTFEQAHPELMSSVTKTWGSTDGVKLYQNFDGDKIIEQWERDKDGNLVNVTERVLAEQRLEEAMKALLALEEQLV